MKNYKFLPLIGILLFFLILSKVNFEELFLLFKNINTTYFIISIFISFSVLFLKALKWKLLIKSYRIDYPLISSVYAWVVGFSFGLITPGRLGDLYRSKFLTEKTTLGKAMTTVILDRLIDILMLFLFSFIGIYLFILYYATTVKILAYVSLFFFIFLIFTIILTKKHIIKVLFRPVFNLFVPGKYKTKAKNLFEEFYKGILIFKKRPRFVLISVIISLLSWIMCFFQYYVLSTSLNLSISFIFIFSIVPITILLDILPFSFSGLGTRDAALIFFFSFIQLSAEQAVSFSIAIFLVNYILPGLIGILLWSIKTKK